MPSPPAEPNGPREPVVQRVRVGLTGLAFVFLLVMLATAFLGHRRDAIDPSVAAQNISEPAEPLAQLGVVPGNPATAESPPAPANPR